MFWYTSVMAKGRGRGRPRGRGKGIAVEPQVEHIAESRGPNEGVQLGQNDDRSDVAQSQVRSTGRAMGRSRSQANDETPVQTPAPATGVPPVGLPELQIMVRDTVMAVMQNLFGGGQVPNPTAVVSQISGSRALIPQRSTERVPRSKAPIPSAAPTKVPTMSKYSQSATEVFEESVRVDRGHRDH